VSLTNTNLAVLNITISSIYLYVGKNNLGKTSSLILGDLKSFLLWIKNSYSPYNAFLTLLLFLLTTWIILAAYLLPPRAIDDITYHLTTIIEFIKQSKIFILPLDYRPHVTMPLNAEFLFMWPLIFFKNDYAIGLVQYIVALIGMVVIYSFSRLFSVNSKVSLFVALLFIFTPVVLAQSGAAYIDVIVSVFFLLSLYFSTKYYLTKKDQYLYLAALSIGLLSGMKYNVLLLALSLQILIIPTVLKTSKKSLAIYGILILFTGGYWYIRNLLVFGSMFPFLDSILRVNDSVGSNEVNIEYLFFIFFEKLRQLFFSDIGIGSLNGGYGINFWAIALPCWIFCLIKSFQLSKENKLFPLYIWLQVILGFVFLFLSPLSRLYFRTRYSIFIIGIALIALAKVIQYYKDQKVYRNIIIISSCIFALIAFINLSNTEIPSYRVDIPIKDRILSKKDYSKMRYLLLTRLDMAYIWETLDYISRDYEKGLNIYFAMTYKDFATPFYGSKFNNHIWNFGKDYTKPPDAYIFQFKKDSKVRYIGNKITMDEVLRKPENKMIDKAGGSYLYLNKKYLEKGTPISKSLLMHYENYYSNEINILSGIIPKLKEDIPIVTSSYLGFVFLHLNVSKSMKNEVYVLPQYSDIKLIKDYGINKFYTLNFVPDDYISKEIANFNLENEEIKIYQNSTE
jgi:hypothetical protein